MNTDTKGFKADIIADSISPSGKRITSFLLKYPRFVHSEVLTHRAFSRNAASSRAIPIQKVIEQVEINPAMPVRWGKNGRGMQDHGWFTGEAALDCQADWIEASRSAAEQAKALLKRGLHKQIVNRSLEPYMWMTTLVTATEWENFYALRVHKDAQPEFQHLGYLMLKAHVASTPAQKEWNEWHIPFGDQMPEGLDETTKMKVATARAARTSYLTMDGKIDVQKDIELHDNLAASGHMSPFEHAAQAWDGRFGNFVGWRQYRYNFPNENRRCDLKELLAQYEAEKVSQ